MPATSNSPVRIKSAGDDGDVTQANLSGAFSAAGNKNDTTQNASQDAGSGHPVLGPLAPRGRLWLVRRRWRHRAGPSASGRRASSRPTRRRTRRRRAPATPTRRCASRASGDDGDVKQINASAAKSAAGNDNQTTQSADQAAGWGGVNVQALGQKAWNGQGARSNATSQQYAPSNANAPVRMHSTGGGGSVAAGQRLCWRCRRRATATRRARSRVRAPVESAGCLREGARAGPREEGGLTARLWPRRPVLGGPAGGPPPPLTHPNGWVSGCSAVLAGSTVDSAKGPVGRHGGECTSCVG